MSALVRMVCGGCLRSVEIDPELQSEPGNRCPFCGGAIESSEDQAGLRTSIHPNPSTKGSDELGHCPAGQSADWTENWSRGSLGSLGRFQLRERLGDGGFGEVYLAFDPRLDRDIALKVLKQPNPSERVMARFFREGRSAARLDHPNIVPVYDAGFDGGRCWVAFHYVSGRPLDWYRDHHRLDPPTAARIIRDLADALDHAHHMGVLHRDLKPANVLIDDLGRPRLIDFGLARRSDLDSSLTHEGAVVGTPAYMSPEQALGFSRQVDERSDVFSLGVIFFEVLSDQRPYPGAGHGTPTEPPAVALASATPSVRALNPLVPAALDRICGRAIARNPHDRYPSAKALVDDLDDWLKHRRGGRARLSFTLTTVMLGLAACLLLDIGVRLAMAPWSEQPRTAIQELRSGSQTQGPIPGPTRVPGSRLDAQTKPFTLIGNSGKLTYHRSWCPDVESMNPKNRIDLENAQAAILKGLKPCQHCKPPMVKTEPHKDASG